MKVVVAPDWREGNPYLTMLEDSVKQADPQVQFIYTDFDGGLFGLLRLWIRHRDADLLHIHWVTDLVAPVTWSRSMQEASVKGWLIGFQARLLRLLGMRIVWTIHNLVSHESLDAEKETIARCNLATAVDRIILHSASAIEVVGREYRLPASLQAEVIPHGNYDGQYPSKFPDIRSVDPRLSKAGEKINILFFGAIRPYKGIDKLLGALNAADRQDIQVLIAGSASSKEIIDQLTMHAARDPRLVLVLRRIRDDELSGLLDWADVVVVPFERTLTSGSVVLAFTSGRPVIASSSARVLDLIDDENGYLFADDELLDVMTKLRKSALFEMRATARSTADRLNRGEIGRRLAKLYSELARR